ncbi:DUF2793 domain-containing protein [uncultured Shimia sp.]|uniref:DUF2793 domain-containing protein n=1 Tax=uncultured Shimia sp. TaxID=573152 RepID=UPI0026144AC5|nr:DUF2793 domain-containing protein [uncultured Shimia sp.]
MSEHSSRLGLPYLMPSQAQKHVTHNDALQKLDVLVQTLVEGFDATTPPALPEEGQIWALGAMPTDVWAGQAFHFAIWSDEYWVFEPLQEGLIALDKMTSVMRLWDGEVWKTPSVEALENLQGLGVNTGVDPTNRLSVAAPATLFSHEGSGHQLKVNKAEEGDTASVLFQTDWSGRAEMGTAASDDFSIKVSPDGVNWTEALVLDQSNGTAQGAAVQSNATDDGNGKLLTVGAFGLGAAQLLTGSSALVSRALKPGLYSYASNGPIDSPEQGAWGHNMVVMRSHPGLGSERLAALAIRTTGSQALRFWIGAQGGSGGAGEPLFWSEVMHHNNIVGAVSQVNGTPSGAIVESGENSNGTYTRWADGTQICTNNNLPITTAPASFAGVTTKIDGNKMWLGRWF